MKAKASSHSPDSVAVIYVAAAAQVFSGLLAQKTGGPSAGDASMMNYLVVMR